MVMSGRRIIADLSDLPESAFGSRTLIWWFYADLKACRRAPDRRRRAADDELPVRGEGDEPFGDLVAGSRVVWQVPADVLARVVGVQVVDIAGDHRADQKPLRAQRTGELIREVGA